MAPPDWHWIMRISNVSHARSKSKRWESNSVFIMPSLGSWHLDGRLCCSWCVSHLWFAWPILFPQPNPTVICPFCSSRAGDFLPTHNQITHSTGRRYLVNISLQIHGQIPLFEWRSQRPGRGQTIAHFTIISCGVQARRFLPPHRPSPPTWSEHWYRATELQMPPIRPEIDLRCSVGLCMILLWQGADERMRCS